MRDGERKALWVLFVVVGSVGWFTYDTTTAGDESVISNVATAASEFVNPITELMDGAREFRAEMDARQAHINEVATEMDGFLVEAGNE